MQGKSFLFVFTHFFKILRSLERKKGIIYPFLRIKRSRLWAKCYTGPLWGRESHVLQAVKRKDNRPSAAAHLRAGGWDRQRRMSAMAPRTTFEGVWNGPHHGGHPLPLSSQSYSQGKWVRKHLMGLNVVSLTWNSVLIKRRGRAWVRPVSCICA